MPLFGRALTHLLPQPIFYAKHICQSRSLTALRTSDYCDNRRTNTRRKFGLNYYDLSQLRRKL